jgi:hypothetical protein
MTMQPAMGAPAPTPYLVTIGAIGATPEFAVTPGGSWHLADVNVSAHDQTSTTTHTPGWAIVMTVITVWFFLLGLLFLLARERRTQGFVAVQLWASNGQSYTEHIQVWTEQQRADVLNRVNYLQSLIGRARFDHGQR